ncbi:MAG: RNA polymerase sigma factor RpoH [Rickettsiales bacterium]|nr:RNA polymerase sigma factor RpoH [Rickettsiales bacterium]
MANANMNLPALSPDGNLHQYLQDIQKFPILEADEEYALAKRWTEDGDYEAAHKLVTSHLRLVAKIASGYRGYGLPMSDMISEGNIGLMQAVKKFDPEKGFRLSTYAMWWIRASIQEFVLKSWSIVKMGTSAAQKRLFFNLKKLRKQLDAVDQPALTPDQIKYIAGELEVNERDVVDMDQRLNANDQFLNARISNDGEGGEWMDLLADESETHEEILGDREEYTIKRNIMNDAMASLNDREKAIVLARRLSDEPRTLEDLSQEFGVSRERIRQIEARAIEKMTQFAEDAQSKPLAIKDVA